MLLRALRKNMKVIAVVVAVAFIAGGTLIYLNTGNNTNANRAKASNEPVAVVNGEEIARNDYQGQLNSQLQQMRGRMGPEQVLSLKSRVLDNVVNQTLLEQKAEEKGLQDKVTEEEIESKLQEVIQQSPASSKEELAKMLKQSGRTIEDYKERIKKFMAIQKLQQEIVGNIEVSEKELKQQYEQVSPSHILIKTEKRSEQEAKQKAEEILQKIENGEDFTKMAKEYSEGPSAKKGGKLGSIGRNSRMAPAFEEKAFSLEVGEVSEPVKTQFGYHLIKVTDKKKAEGEEYEKQKEKLKQKLVNQKKQKEFETWLNNVREEAEIEIKDQEIKAYKAAQNENYEEAIASYKEALNSSSSGSSYLYHNLADAYKQQDKQDKAIETYQEAIEKNPEEASFYSNLANLHKENGNNEQAISIYEDALEKNEDNAQLHFNLGNLYREMEQQDKAITQYEKFSELSGDNLMAHYRLYTVYKQMGMTEKANKERKKVQEIQKKQQQQQQQQQPKTNQNQ